MFQQFVSSLYNSNAEYLKNDNIILLFKNNYFLGHKTFTNNYVPILRSFTASKKLSDFYVSTMNVICLLFLLLYIFNIQFFNILHKLTHEMFDIVFKWEKSIIFLLLLTFIMADNIPRR